jgi:hypothetical protein
MLQSGIEYRSAILENGGPAQGKFILSPVLFLIIHAPIAGSSMPGYSVPPHSDEP